MNDSTDFDRIAQSWLQDGPTEMPDRSLQAALDEVHVTSQRRFGAARRTFHMNGNAPRLAVAAVIGLLILVGGGIYLGNNGSGGVGAPAATATPTPVPSPTPITTTSAPSTVRLTPGLLCSATYCPAGTLEPGTFYHRSWGVLVQQAYVHHASGLVGRLRRLDDNAETNLARSRSRTGT